MGVPALRPEIPGFNPLVEYSFRAQRGHFTDASDLLVSST